MAKAIYTHKDDDLYAATPPIEALKVLLRIVAHRKSVSKDIKTLFADANLMLGDWAGTITLFENYDGFLLAALPPGAFIGLGFLLAIKNVIDQNMRKRRTSNVVVDIPGGNTEPAISQPD